MAGCANTHALGGVVLDVNDHIVFAHQHDPRKQLIDLRVAAVLMWHPFMHQALDAIDIGSEWYAEPAGLVDQSCHGQMAYYVPGAHG